ncbi:MAG: Stp1/IreP family PP2C-type Ser/Thr phosphatase [Syntrophomonadaceae bacterium]|nr:Stp1/IreP family PP2C-type Ser/Thr phosphatase [Syntrophomonadaceae bacterium]
MFWGVNMRAIVLSDIGRIRRQNQDRFLVDEKRGLFVVCDGMGGHKAGEVAAQIAIDTIWARIDLLDEVHPHQFLSDSIMEANRQIYSMARQNEEFSDMGTTITAAIIKEMILYVGHIGDSSLYLIREDGPQKLTRDHTMTERMLREGLLSEDEIKSNRYRHILTRALGVEDQVEIDLFTSNLQYEDKLILTTDGLTDLVEPWEIWDKFEQESDIDRALSGLMTIAYERGGHDNITMIAVVPS